jgi:dephospho-CoA kinase
MVQLNSDSMLKVGLTGGIGSGKTTVAKIFELLNVPVYYADDAAKRIMNDDESLKSKIKTHFGDQSYLNGELNRRFIASQVFNDNHKLELLNAMVHPVTMSDALHWFQQQTTPYAIKEAALLFEAGAAEHLDLIIGVFAPRELRIKRTVDRGELNREEVVKRMNRQIDEDIKIKLCDFVLKNDEEQLLIPQVLELHQKLLSLGKEKPTTI